MFSHLAAEAPFYLALFLCGILGHVAVWWFGHRFGTQEEEAGTPNSRLPKKIEELPELAPAAIRGAQEASWPALPQGTRHHRRGKAQKARMLIQDGATSSADSSISSTGTDVLSEAVDQAREQAALLAVSDRVARLMAKKAERKARKAAREAEFAALQAVPELPGVQALAEDLCEPCTDTDEAQKQPMSPTKDVSIAELSTADEGQSSTSAAQDTEGEEEESFDEREEEEEEKEKEKEEEEVKPEDHTRYVVRNVWPMSEAYPGSSFYEEDSCQEDDSSPPVQDGWMTSLDDLLCSQCQSFHYQPVLSPDGQQLYTDGQQMFVLACVETRQEPANQSEVQVMTPLVDPRDPAHALLLEVCGSAPSPSSPNPALESWQTKAEGLEVTDMWNTCWDL